MNWKEAHAHANTGLFKEFFGKTKYFNIEGKHIITLNAGDECVRVHKDGYSLPWNHEDGITMSTTFFKPAHNYEKFFNDL